MNEHVDEKSDSVVVPTKPPNKEGVPSAEGVEGRTLPEGNSDQTAADRTQGSDNRVERLCAERRNKEKMCGSPRCYTTSMSSYWNAAITR